MAESTQTEVGLELSDAMLSKIAPLFNVLIPYFVDVSKLKFYEDKFNEHERLRGEDLEKAGGETIHARDLAHNYLRVAKRFELYAHSQCKAINARLYRTEAKEFLKNDGVKDSHAAREKYIDQNEEYIRCSDLEDDWKVLCDWLENKADSFDKKHMWIKKQIDLIISDFKRS